MIALERIQRFKTNVVSYSILWGLGLFLNGVLLSALFHTLLPSSGMGADAKLVQLASHDFLSLAVTALLFAPWYEALLGQWLPIELMRRFRVPPGAIVIVCGLVFGIGHYLSNGLVHGLKTFVDGLLYGVLYLSVRDRSAVASWLTATGAHFVNNLCALSLMLFMR